MAHTTFVDTVTHVPSAWANDVDKLVYGIFGGAQDVASVKTVLGLRTLAFADANSVNLTGGSVDGMTVGITDPQAAKFTTVLLNSAITQAKQAATKEYVDGLFTPLRNGMGTMGGQDADAVNIDGGTIDGTVIGGVTPAAGTFTVLQTTHTPAAAADVITKAFFDAYVASVPVLHNMAFQDNTSVNIDGGTIDGTAIGGTIASPGKFSTLTAPSLIGTKATAYLNGGASGFGSYGVFVKATDTSLPHIGLQLGHAVSQFTVNSVTGSALLSLKSAGRLIVGGVTDDGASAIQTSGDVSASRYLLSGAITIPNQAASKSYVDNLVAPLADIVNGLIGDNDAFLSMAQQASNAVHITGGTIDGVVIGGTTPAAATFSTLNVQSTIAGALSGALIHMDPLANYGLSLSTSSEFYTDIKLVVPDGGKVDVVSGGNKVLSALSRGAVMVGVNATDDGLSALVVKGDLKVTGQLRLTGTQMNGSGTALLGANCPATNLSAPHTWVKVILPGEVVGWMPVFV